MHNRLQHLFFFCVFAAVLVLVFFIIQSFLPPLVMALALAIVFQPLYRYIKHRFNTHDTLAALVTVIIILIIVVVPLIFIGQQLFNEALTLYTSVAGGHGQTWFDQSVNNLQTYLQVHIAPQITLNASDYIQQGLQWTVSRLNGFFAEFLRLAFETLIMVIALFYILRDGHILRDQYVKISPLPNEYDERIITTLSSAIGSVIKGSLIVAVLQAIQGSVAVLIGGYSSPIIWGIFIGIASFLPGVGTGVIMIPLIIFTFLAGNILQGVLLTIWYILAVSLIDSVLSPHVMRRGGIKVHPFMILLGVIGGVVIFGPIGFIVGPLIMALFFALVELFPFVIEKT